MKKYIALVAAVMLLTGCGGGSENGESTSTTETEITTEESTETEEETRESITESEEREEETVNQQEVKNEVSTVNESIETTNATGESFEDSEAYKELQSLASNAGFEISYSDNNVVFRTYITDDTIDNIKEKNADYADKWDENCGLYEEFCSEAVRAIKSNNAEGVNAIVEVVGRSDNQVYFRNENGTSIYNAYNE